MANLEKETTLSITVNRSSNKNANLEVNKTALFDSSFSTQFVPSLGIDPAFEKVVQIANYVQYLIFSTNKR